MNHLHNHKGAAVGPLGFVVLLLVFEKTRQIIQGASYLLKSDKWLRQSGVRPSSSPSVHCRQIRIKEADQTQEGKGFLTKDKRHYEQGDANISPCS